MTSASNLFRDRVARAALPQNCSLAKIEARPDFANGTLVPRHCPKVLSLPSNFKTSLCADFNEDSPISARANFRQERMMPASVLLSLHTLRLFPGGLRDKVAQTSVATQTLNGGHAENGSVVRRETCARRER